MEVKCSTETSVNFQQTTRLYVPKDKTLHNHRCENLISFNEGMQKRMGGMDIMFIWFLILALDECE
jgi:hypothetical protein